MKSTILLALYSVSARSIIEDFGMTEAPEEPLAEDLVQLQGEGGWNNKPWKVGGYMWDQTSVEKFLKVPDSHSYIAPYDAREFSWNDD